MKRLTSRKKYLASELQESFRILLDFGFFNHIPRLFAKAAIHNEQVGQPSGMKLLQCRDKFPFVASLQFEEVNK